MAALAACGGAADDEETDVDRNRRSAVDTIPLVMPEHPPPVPGHLTLQSNAREEQHRFAGSWATEAGVCHEPTVIQMVARSDSVAAIVFVGPGEDDTMVGEYEVSLGREGIPDSSMARVGIHTYGRNLPRGFRAIAGMVEIQRSDTVLVGRLTAEFAEDRFQDTILLAASFEMPLQDAPADWCLVFDPESALPVRPTRQQR
jgi:hypothetical protein